MSGNPYLNQLYYIFFQSHIAGDWNDNVWNEDNYLQMKESLKFLKARVDLDIAGFEKVDIWSHE